MQLKKYSFIYIILVFVLINIEFGIADKVNSNYNIYFKSRQFVPEEGIKNMAKISSINTEGIHVLIQFNSIPSVEQRQMLKEEGVKLLDYVPDKSWFISVISGELKTS